MSADNGPERSRRPGDGPAVRQRGPRPTRPTHRELDRLLAEVRAAVGGSGSPARVFPRLIAAVFSYAEDSADDFRVLTNPELTAGGLVVNEIADVIEDLLSDAGVVEPVARTYAHAIAGMLLHSAVQWSRSRSPHRSEIVDYLTDFALHGVSLIDAPESRADMADLVVYTSADDGSEARDAVLDLLEVTGWTEVRRESPQPGSWYQRLWLRGKEVDKLNDLAAKLERSLTLKHIDTPRTENDEREAAAIERLAKATENVDEVAIKTSSILFVKHGGQMVVRVLTEAEIAIIDKHPELMRDPAELLLALQQPTLTPGHDE